MQILQSDVFEEIEKGALVLTANRRLFRHLRENYDRWMLNTGKSVWKTPQIFSYEGWLSICLDELGQGWQVLSSHQEQYLWESVISEATRGTAIELLQLSQTAERAVQAHHLLTEYEAVIDNYALTDDQQVFLEWREKFLADCKKRELFDKSFVPGKVCQAIKERRIAVPGKVLLVGFDQLSPGLISLQEIAEERGGSCREVVFSSDFDTNAMRFCADDKREEITAAAQWTRKLLDEGAQSIGIVVPDLVHQRRTIERIFSQQIDPESSLIGRNEDKAFSLSLGSPLAEEGIVHAALEILGCGYAMSIDQVSFLLRTPYLAGSLKEADTRALFDRRLRSFGQQDFTIRELRSLIAEDKGLTELAVIFEKMEAGLKEESRAPGLWAQCFSELLKEIGWPGQKVISSHEFQAMKSWQQKVLEAMPTLDAILPQQTRSQALNLLKRMTINTDFQLESPTGQVQVVGLLESSGLCFDHMWVMGLEDRVLPAVPQPNPFLPFRLQNDLQMPRASVEREYRFAEQVVERLLGASPDIVLSYPQREGDLGLRPSPLIRDLGRTGSPPLAQLSDLLSRACARWVKLERIADRRGLAVEQSAVSGGTGLLKDQAHCPFRAYVHHRLKCRALDEAIPGIGAMERGDLVHLALERIWNQLRERRRLVELDDEQRMQLIEGQVEGAVDDYYKKSSKPVQAMVALEKERVADLVETWLTEIEVGRDDFSVVATEQELETQIGPLTIRLKVDRIDRLEDGTTVVIDYKTGNRLKAEDFLSRPLIEPQLPVYAVSSDDHQADGIAFAQVRKDGCRFVGLVRHPDQLGKVKDLKRFDQAEELGIEDWAGLLAFWTAELNQLALDFAAGEAQVRPFDSEESCRFCDLAGICRIDDVVSMRGAE